MEKENLIDLYYEKLHKTKNPGNLISRFYWELFSIPPNRTNIIMFNKFIKLYGRNLVFFSTVDLFYIDKLDHTNLYGIFRYLINKRLERRYGKSNVNIPIDLTRSIKKMQKDIKKLKKKEIEFENPFNGDENDNG
ncbi:hypothetical protein LCGC14_1653520 [marine sediment metagenome]|uniref:Uncharacterized protein n=1 Tax=marine sediment metagenome TaxID=412755 RepID=A0A0F9KWE6_9ZZZZ